MSDTQRVNKVEAQNLSEPNKSEGKREIASRRKFMRNAVTVAVGASMALSTPPRLLARLLARQTVGHVDDFLNRAKGFKTSAEATREFQRVAALILDITNKDQKARADLEEIRAWLTETKLSTPTEKRLNELGVPEDVGALGAVAYLRALSALQQSRYRLTFNDVKSRLANTKRIIDGIEPDFVNQLFVKTKGKTERDPAFAQKVAAATKELAMVVQKLSSEGKLQSRQAMEQHLRLQESGWHAGAPVLNTPTAYPRECNLFGAYPAPEAVCIAGVAIVVIIIIVKIA